MNTSKTFFIPKLTIMGIGLIGGSLAKALKHYNIVGKVIAYDCNEKALENALALNVADEVYFNPIEASNDSDMIVLSMPITQMGEIVKEIIPHLKKNAVITDVGSTKGSVITSIQSTLGYLPEQFVPAHPIAGTEKHGVENAITELFKNRKVVITPHLDNHYDAIEMVKKMWLAIGADVEEMGISHHDQVLAATSHLPHLLAFATVDTLANLDDRSEIFKFAAGGFRDFTRISTSDPQMWADICLQNQEHLLAVMQAFQEKIALLQKALEEKDNSTIFEIFKRAKHARDNFYREP